MKKREEKLQMSISKYIRLQYPDVIFTAESSGIKLPIGLAVKIKDQRSNHKHLDLIILQPKGEYHGLILELKNTKSDVFTKSGQLRKSEHIFEQYKMIRKFNSINYFSDFVFGFEHAKKVIDWYMGL
jgi:hypothetical protein